MRVAIVALTEAGRVTALRLAKGLGDAATVYTKQNRTADGAARPITGGLGDFLGLLWRQYAGLVLIMATGIAVRCLAPYLEDKYRDPAVVVLDEQGCFAISLLSGHLGGANALARRVAGVLGGEAVITTASDRQGLPTLDLLARELGLKPTPLNRLTSVSAALVNGRRMALWAEEPWLGRCRHLAAALPVFPLSDYTGPDGWEAGVLVTELRWPDPGPGWLFLRPPQIVAGIGCRRGATAGSILTALGRALRESGLSRWSLAKLASLDLKSNEPGLLAAARRLSCPLQTYAAQELAAVLADRTDLSFSTVVLGKVGVGGVCEPAALLAAGGGELLLRKRRYQGVTVALAKMAW